MQEQMFPLAVQAINASATRDESGFWHLRVATRVEGERWTGAEWRHYDRLTTAELLDVVAMEIAR